MIGRWTAIWRRWRRRQYSQSRPAAAPVGMLSGPPVNLEECRRAIEQTEQQATALIRLQYPDARMFHYGAFEISPHCLVFFATTRSDQQRDALAQDAALEAEFRRMLRANGYPAEAIPSVHLCFESEETVSRDYNGSWWQRIK